MRKIYSAGSYTEAQMLRGYLEHLGIKVEIMNEHSAGTPGTPHWALPVSAELWVVDEARYSEAAQRIREYFEDDSEDSKADWQCTKCKEQNPGSFDVCWNCGDAVGKAT